MGLHHQKQAFSPRRIIRLQALSVAAPSVPVAPADLSSHTCIRSRLPSGAIYRWGFEKCGEQMAIDVEGALTVDNQNVMRDAAVRGLGPAYMTEWLVQEDIAQARLIRVLSDWTPSLPGLRVYYPDHRHVPAGPTRVYWHCPRGDCTDETGSLRRRLA